MPDQKGFKVKCARRRASCGIDDPGKLKSTATLLGINPKLDEFYGSAREFSTIEKIQMAMSFSFRRITSLRIQKRTRRKSAPHFYSSL